MANKKRFYRGVWQLVFFRAYYHGRLFVQKLHVYFTTPVIFAALRNTLAEKAKVLLCEAAKKHKTEKMFDV